MNFYHWILFWGAYLVFHLYLLKSEFYFQYVRRNQVSFLVYEQDSEKKIASVGPQNKKNIIWSLESVFFKKIFCIANTEEKPLKGLKVPF